MLLETKGVVHLALLFGSTWMVNSIVFFAILVMVLLSNLFVLAVSPRRLWPYYVLLFAALAVNIVVPMSTFLALPGAAKVVASCAVVFVPIFFAGIIFATVVPRQPPAGRRLRLEHRGRDPRRPGESLSLMVGFNYLLAVALLFYVLSAVLRPASGAGRWTTA